jgi:1-acyl-sn-glycerol-3-phosphate acyltransferase
MQLIKSLIFNIFLYSGIVLVFIFAIPTLLLPNKFTLYCGKFLAYYIILLLKVILNTKVVFHGLGNLKKKKNFL